MPGPTAGQVIDGYRFRGGDPNNRASWEPVGGAAAGDPPGSTRLANGTLMGPAGPRGGAPQALIKLSTQEQVQLGNARRIAAQQRLDLDDSERFARLAEEQPTGGFFGLPVVGDFLASVRAPYDPTIDEMREISGRLVPVQHTTGGPMTDADARLYNRVVPSVSRTPESNTAIIDRGRSRAGASQLRAEFLDAYSKRNGTLIGAEEAWNNIYQPPPVARNSPQPRANVRPTEAQRSAIEALPNRNRSARLGDRTNPRAPPAHISPDTLPAGDWYVDTNGRLAQVPGGRRERGNAALRNQSGRGGVTVRRVS